MIRIFDILFSLITLLIKGDVLHVFETENGIELIPYDPAFDAQMAVAEDIMHENRDVLRRLAK